MDSPAEKDARREFHDAVKTFGEKLDSDTVRGLQKRINALKFHVVWCCWKKDGESLCGG